MLLQLLKLVPPENFSLLLPNEYISRYPKKKLISKNEKTDALVDLIEDKIIGSPIGWAGLYKPFNDMGFKLISKETLLYIDDRNYFEADHGRFCQNLSAVLSFFELSEEEEVYLFNKSSFSNLTIEEVIERLDDFICSTLSYNTL